MSSLILDTTVYPHLLDRVIDLAPYGSLVALRAASRDIRDRADAILASGHLIVGNDVRCHHGGRLPAFANWTGGPLTLTPCKAVDLMNPKAVLPLDPSTPLSFGRIIIPNIHTTGRPPNLGDGDFYRLSTAFDTIVLFTSLPTGFMEPRLPTLNIRPRRFVRHITFYPRHRRATGDHGNTTQNLIPEESVWIFRLAPGDAKYPRPGSGVTPLLGRLHDRVIEDMSGGARVILVGIDQLVGMDALCPKDPIVPTVFAALSQHPGIERLSFDEYCTTVGPGRAALETVMES
ncbi:hypothetical protein CspHIS471_0610990 [Cutaneotrichosporon sp. HIS471]|nr:hypothetical protein CspHIS471_0610990 [Cutaneotrichosporon sp. HIS471]